MARRKRNIEASIDEVLNEDVKGGAREDVKPIGESAHEEETPKRERKVAKKVGGVVSGDILGSDRMKRVYPVALYVSVLIFVYIFHIYNFQRLQRVELARKIELNEQRSRSVVFTSLRMNASRHSNIMREIDRRGLGLKESVTPPKYVGDD